MAEPDDDLTARVRKAAEGCCMNDNWRGRMCSYHEGYADGLEAAQRDSVLAGWAGLKP